MSGCDYQGHEFGACYPDSVCIDGRLWDADSCDEPGGDLTIGGDIPCPKCNHDAWLLHVGDDIMQDGHVAGYEGKDASECPYQANGKPGNALHTWHEEHDPYIFRFAWLKGYWDGIWERKQESAAPRRAAEMSTQRQRTTAVVRGIAIADIKEMVEQLYGACYWHKDEHGKRWCFPTSDSSIEITISPAREGQSDV